MPIKLIFSKAAGSLELANHLLESEGYYRGFNEAFETGHLDRLPLEVLVFGGARYTADHQTADPLELSIRRTPIFKFCRILKAHHYFAQIADEKDQGRAWKALLAVLKRAKVRPKRFFRVYLGYTKLQTAEDHFRFGWTKVKLPAGKSPLELALIWANRSPLFPQLEDDGSVHDFHRFLNMLFYLRVKYCELPDGRILLPVEKLALLLGCDHSTISRHRDRAKRREYIREVEPYSVKEGKATTFMVDVRKMVDDARKAKEKIPTKTSAEAQQGDG